MDDDGFFYFKGRSDSIVKFNGAKFYYKEYIQKINTLKDINQGHIFITEDNINNAILVVCLESMCDQSNHDKIRFDINDFFPDYQKPNHILFFEKFPFLSNGKIDRRQLRQLAISRIGEC